MCGILAVADLQSPVTVPELRASVDRMTHRGPDDSDVWAMGGVGLAHRRLSIQDLSSRGRQPMATADRALVIVHNGEVYNFRELRKELAGRDYVSDSDTEVVLQAYKRWGEECLARLHGMFAFVVFDASRRKLFFARDRFGIKPLFFSRFGSRFVIASEIKAILALGHSAKMNTLALMDLVFNGDTRDERVLFQGVQKLPAGAFGVVDLDTLDLKIQTYYRPEPDPELCELQNDPEDVWLRLMDEELTRSISQRLISDAPVGTFCSGGIDSSLISAIARREHPAINAFNVAMPSHRPSDEGPFASAVAKHLGIELHTLELTAASYREALVEAVDLHEAPLSFLNTIPLLLVSRLAAERGIKVLLSGEGADELFGGYIDQYRALALRRLVETRGRLFGAAFSRGVGLANLANRLLGLPSFPKHGGIPLHGLLTGGSRWMELEEVGLRLYDHLKDGAEREIAAHLVANLRHYLVPILKRTDAATMGASVEARVPFLEHDMVRLALSVPTRFKCAVPGLRPVGKSILKKLATRYLPREIVYRKKVGFGVPKRIHQLAWPDSWVVNGFVAENFQLAPDRLRAWLAVAADEDGARLLSLEVWGQRFLRDRPREVLEDEIRSAAFGSRN